MKLVIKLANEGMTIIFISSEMAEMVRCCDRVLVLRDRKIIRELIGEEIKEVTIMETIAEGGISYGKI